MALSQAAPLNPPASAKPAPGHALSSGLATAPSGRDGDSSGVSWGAIAAGAATAAALSLILLMLGMGLGLSSVSPWGHYAMGAATLGVSAIVWATVTQILAAGMGGYLAGRLRTRWLGVHSDEVYFRDTAHGFLAWALASLLTAALLTPVIGGIVGGGIQGGVEMVNPDRDNGPLPYFVDTLFRSEIPAHGADAARVAAEAGENQAVARIFLHNLRSTPLPADDVRYIGQLVAERTGLSRYAAELRVSATYGRVQAYLHNLESVAKEAAENVFKASAYAALWLFISLLVGAFVASLAATYGGRRRDLCPTIPTL